MVLEALENGEEDIDLPIYICLSPNKYYHTAHHSEYIQKMGLS